MRDVVIVPCFERPEFTRVCLEYLSRARGIDDKELWLCQDAHDPYDGTFDAMLPVVDYAYETFPNNFVHKMIACHNTYGNSKNLLHSMRLAYLSRAPRVFLVEDDIMVMPDFFEWHEEVLCASEFPFVSCATSLNKSAHFPINGRHSMDESFQSPDAYYIATSAYSSHAAAFTRSNLGEVVQRFANDTTYECLRSGAEQDILIQGLMASTPNCGSAWPYIPRAYNVGIYSYHISGMRFNGSFEEKVNAVRSVIKDPEKLKSMAYGNQTVTSVPDNMPARIGPIYNTQRYR